MTLTAASARRTVTPGEKFTFNLHATSTIRLLGCFTFALDMNAYDVGPLRVGSVLRAACRMPHARAHAHGHQRSPGNNDVTAKLSLLSPES